MSNDTVIAIAVYKILCLAIGTAFGYMGYRLFLKGVIEKAGDLQTDVGKVRVVLTGAAPGIFFALFGTAIIALTVYKGFEASAGQREKSPSLTPSNGSGIPTTVTPVQPFASTVNDEGVPNAPSASARPSETNRVPTGSSRKDKLKSQDTRPQSRKPVPTNANPVPVVSKPVPTNANPVAVGSPSAQTSPVTAPSPTNPTIGKPIMEHFGPDNESWQHLSGFIAPRRPCPASSTRQSFDGVGQRREPFNTIPEGQNILAQPYTSGQQGGPCEFNLSAPFRLDVPFR